MIHRPKGFVHKQRRVRSWLQDVRRTYSRAHTGPGKQCVKTFLLSNADYEHVDSLMSYAYVTMGPRLPCLPASHTKGSFHDLRQNEKGREREVGRLR